VSARGGRGALKQTGVDMAAASGASHSTRDMQHRGRLQQIAQAVHAWQHAEGHLVEWRGRVKLTTPLESGLKKWGLSRSDTPGG
jgi:hypothetical protein